MNEAALVAAAAVPEMHRKRHAFARGALKCFPAKTFNKALINRALSNQQMKLGLVSLLATIVFSSF